MNFTFFHKKLEENQNKGVEKLEDKEMEKLEENQNKGTEKKGVKSTFPFLHKKDGEQIQKKKIKKGKIEILILKNGFVQKNIKTNIIEKEKKEYVIINKKEYELTYSIPGAVRKLAFFDMDKDNFIDPYATKSVEKGYPSQVIQNYIEVQLKKVSEKKSGGLMQILAEWAPLIIGLIFFLVALYFASETHVLNCVWNATQNVTTTTTIYPFPFPVVPK
jgi:hypothetical protein